MGRLSIIAALTRLLMKPRMCTIRLTALFRKIRVNARYDALYRKYTPFTMVPHDLYRKNLSLVDELRCIPGCVVECGVWRGGMIAGMAEVLGTERQYVLFDSFQGLPPAQLRDGQAAIAWQADITSPNYFANCAAPQEFAMRAMALARVSKVAVFPGWFEDTVRGYIPPEPIAVLRLDGDWYESTMVCLEALFPHLAPGGVVIVDDYSTWDGCRLAVHDYLSRQKSAAQILRWRDAITYIRTPYTLNAV